MPFFLRGGSWRPMEILCSYPLKSSENAFRKLAVEASENSLRECLRNLLRVFQAVKMAFLTLKMLVEEESMISLCLSQSATSFELLCSYIFS